LFETVLHAKAAGLIAIILGWRVVRVVHGFYTTGTVSF
jgi:hypothetical protein